MEADAVGDLVGFFAVVAVGTGEDEKPVDDGEDAQAAEGEELDEAENDVAEQKAVDAEVAEED